MSNKDHPFQSQEYSIPKSFSGLILESVGNIRYDQILTPELLEGDLLIRVKATTTCGTDLKAFRRGHPQIPMPGGFGHEYSGVVAAIGKNAKFQPGDEIVGVHTAPCQLCRWCKKGQENLCETIMETKVLGTFAQFVRIPKRIADLNVFPKPVGLSFEQGSLLEPLACVMQGIMNINFGTVQNALVIGPGAIGLMFGAMLKRQGVQTLVAGRSPLKLGVANKLGLETVKLDELAIEPHFDLVVECTGNAEIWQRTLKYAAKGAQVVLFGGLPSGTLVTFDSQKIHYDQITMLSPFHFGSHAVKYAFEILQDLDLSALISGERDLKDAKTVFQDLAEGRGIKYLFRP